MAGLTGLINGGKDIINGNGISDHDHEHGHTINFEETQSEIFLLTSYSARLEKILLALLRQQNIMKDEMKQDKIFLASAIEKVAGDLGEEARLREKQLDNIKSDVEDQNKSFDLKLKNLADEMNDSMNELKKPPRCRS